REPRSTVLFFTDTAPTEIYTLSLHDALPILPMNAHGRTFGSITLEVDESGRRFDGADLATALALAQRAALAVESSRLYEEAEYRSEEHTSELQSRRDLVCRLLLEKKKQRRTK